MAGGAGTIGYRIASLSYRAHDQELIIHNFTWTYRVPVSRIKGFDTGKSNFHGGMETVRVLTNRGTIQLDVLIVMEQDRRMQALAGWLAAARRMSQMTETREA